jgi:hypothetical protein
MEKGRTKWCATATMIICRVITALLLTVPAVHGGGAQTAAALPQVKKVYVDSLGDKNGAAALRERLIQELNRSHAVQTVPSSSEADAVITGNGEIWVKGYYMIGSRPSAYSRQPVYGGALSVELKGKDNETLWSYIVTASKSQSGGIVRDLADHLAKKLVEALHQESGTGAPH